MFKIKKDKKVKETPKFIVTFKKLWNNKKTHAAMVLGMYFIFIAFILILSVITNNTKTIMQNNPAEIKYEDIFDYMANANYSYEYKIKINNSLITYKGEIAGSIDTGYKETNEEIIKYTIEDGTFYQIKGEEKHEYPELYLGIDFNLINLNYLFLLTKPLEYALDKVDSKSVYTYNNVKIPSGEEPANIIITANNKNIESITITILNENYELKFNNISKIDNEA